MIKARLIEIKISGTKILWMLANFLIKVALKHSSSSIEHSSGVNICVPFDAVPVT